MPTNTRRLTAEQNREPSHGLQACPPINELDSRESTERVAQPATTQPDQFDGRALEQNVRLVRAPASTTAQLADRRRLPPVKRGPSRRDELPHSAHKQE